MTESRRSLLAVVAHPDDEVFIGGVLAHFAASGVRTTLVCATDGEAGDIHPSVGPVTDLGAVRANELRLSCARLGIGEPRRLGFHDSGRGEQRRRDDPHALANVDLREVEVRLHDLIADVKPQVIVTFDPHGWYYHLDHLAVHRAVSAAFFSSGRLGPAAPERLFFGTMLPEVFRAFAAASRGLGIVDGLEADLFATDSGMIATVFDARPYLDQKLSALAAHRSAFGLSEEMLRHPTAEAEQTLRAFTPVLEQETFAVGGVRGAIPRWPLQDFFDGLL